MAPDVLKNVEIRSFFLRQWILYGVLEVLGALLDNGNRSGHVGFLDASMVSNEVQLWVGLGIQS